MNRYILGIVKQDTAKKILKANETDGGFVLMPKDVLRHKPEIFKPSIQPLFKQSLKLIREIEKAEGYTTRNHLCEYYAEIIETFFINFDKSSDREFIKLISPFYPWTHNHVYEYLTGKDTEIERTVGKGAGHTGRKPC